MAQRGTLYRCQLFSFAGPQTEGVVSRWTQNLEPVGDREVLSGEQVELLATVQGSLHRLTEDARVRFDVLEEDFLLTGLDDDVVVSFVGPGAPEPEEGFVVQRRSTSFSRMADGQGLATHVAAFKASHPLDHRDRILIAQEGEGIGVRYHVVTWWTAEAREDFANAELYFILNVDGRFEDQSEEILNVSPIWTPEDPTAYSAWESPAPNPNAVQWERTRAEPGEMVGLWFDGASLTEGLTVTVGVVADGLVGEIVDTFDVVLLGLPPYRATWCVPDDPDADSYRFLVSLFDQDPLLSRNLLEIRARVQARLVFPSGLPAARVRYQIFDDANSLVREGMTDAEGRLVEVDLPPSASRLEINDLLVQAVAEAPRPVPQPALPEAAGRTFAFVLTSSEGLP